MRHFSQGLHGLLIQGSGGEWEVFDINLIPAGKIVRMPEENFQPIQRPCQFEEFGGGHAVGFLKNVHKSSGYYEHDDFLKSFKKSATSLRLEEKAPDSSDSPIQLLLERNFSTFLSSLCPELSLTIVKVGHRSSLGHKISCKKYISTLHGCDNWL
jgi:hypothetical protein